MMIIIIILYHLRSAPLCWLPGGNHPPLVLLEEIRAPLDEILPFLVLVLVYEDCAYHSISFLFFAFSF